MCEYPAISQELQSLKESDLQRREQLLKEGTLFEGYHPDMERMHIENGHRLQEIIQEIGWPNKTKVGEAGSEAAWMILQNAISLPQLQRESLPLLKDEIMKGEMEPHQYAHLVDRVCFFERKPQKYGTQIDWDENGDMSPWLLEDEEKVEQLRASMGLPSLSSEVERVRNEIKEHHISPPEDMEKRNKEINEWRRRVGWM